MTDELVPTRRLAAQDRTSHSALLRRLLIDGVPTYRPGGAPRVVLLSDVHPAVLNDRTGGEAA